MSYIITGVVSFAVAMLAFILQGVMKENKHLKEEQKKQHEEKDKALENAVVALLRKNMVDCHTRCMKIGSISTYELQNWLLMYKAYKDLGGNGMVDHMEEDIQELPLK